jgi:hypothetical protein
MKQFQGGCSKGDAFELLMSATYANAATGFTNDARENLPGKSLCQLLLL